MDTIATEYSAWNPGLESALPRKYLPLATVFRPENVITGLAKALELSEYCGLPAHELVAFRPERLMVHELLIRVTTEVSVPDGRDYEDLGRNFREIAAAILKRHLAPRQAEIVQVFERLKADAAAKIERELSRALAGSPSRVEAAPRRGWWRFFGRGKAPKRSLQAVEAPAARDRRVAAEWWRKSAAAIHGLDEACFDALGKVATGVMSRHGRLVGDQALITELAVTLVCNNYGSEVIGDAIASHFQEAVASEGYRILPQQQRPVVMNVKGASASGKSSMRPLQKKLAGKLDLPWDEFALISPDIWRKFLLDYGSLGVAYKYAGMLSGHELEIVDKKLDRRMAARSARGEMSHLLIDRFRFDSFEPELEGKGSTKLLTRFGNLIYMFFMITPPEATVERAWIRGLKVGRYKAVDDLLAHNVEAYTGMPELFFTWALSARQRVHYEFLDNSVPEGQAPRTVAFGWNGEMTILDIKRMLDIERFRKINIAAQRPEEVYLNENLAPECNADFLKRCARWIPVINFADADTGSVYARLERGRWAWRDEVKFVDRLKDAEARAGLTAVAPKTYDADAAAQPRRMDVVRERAHTLGTWA